MSVPEHEVPELCFSFVHLAMFSVQHMMAAAFSVAFFYVLYNHSIAVWRQRRLRLQKQQLVLAYHRSQTDTAGTKVIVLLLLAADACCSDLSDWLSDMSLLSASACACMCRSIDTCITSPHTRVVGGDRAAVQ